MGGNLSAWELNRRAILRDCFSRLITLPTIIVLGASPYASQEQYEKL